MNRTIHITFEETGETGFDSKGRPGKKFNVYMSGDIERLGGDQKLQMKDISTAEFWASRAFDVVVDLLRRANVIQTETKRQ